MSLPNPRFVHLQLVEVHIIYHYSDHLDQSVYLRMDEITNICMYFTLFDWIRLSILILN